MCIPFIKNSLDTLRAALLHKKDMDKRTPSSRRVLHPEKYEYAYLLYMQGVPQKDVCEKVGVSSPTLIKWKEDGGCDTKRAAKTISVDELVVKTLRKINELLESPDFNADAFAKAVNQLKSLKTKNTVDDVLKCFLDFQTWVIQNRSTFPEIIGNDFIHSLAKIQDMYIQFRIGNGRC